MAVDLTPIKTTGFGWGLDISADGRPEFLMAGASVDWATIVALASPLTMKDGTVLATGTKVLLPGQVLSGITAATASIRMFGPYDPAATGTGRETALAGRDDVGIVRKLVVYDPTMSNRFRDSIISLVTGGRVWKGMIRATTGTASLANGPTWADLRSALPRLIPVSDARAAHT